MLQKIMTIWIIPLNILLFGCTTLFFKTEGGHPEITEKQLLHKKDPFGNYGQTISLEEVTDLDVLLTSPSKFLNEEILITGEITEVCPMRGCWINVKQHNSDAIIRVKVTDGKIVFPLSSKGKHVNVQGIVKKLELTEQQARNWKIHLAEEKGEILSPDSVIIKETDLIEYRINGQAAVIYPITCYLEE